MEPISISDIVKWTGGKLVAGEAEGKVAGVSTDSRNDCAGSLFVPIKGDNFDGHDFIKDAIEKGAVAVITERVTGEGDYSPDVALIKVGNTLRAFQDLAACYRRQFELKVVGITGSNGKTTTKEFVRSVSAARFETAATEGTKNNHIGLPHSLLSISSGTGVGVFEMGMSGLGEIRNLAQIALPDIGVITNICPVHTEFFKSVEDVALSKSELLEALDDDAVAVLNADDDWFEFLKQRTRSKIISFGIENTSDVTAGSIKQTAEGTSFSVSGVGGESLCSIKAFGKHNVYNALAAIAVGFRLDIELEEACEALSRSNLPDMRFQLEDIGGITVINDAYNANPVSTIAALDALNEVDVPGRRIALLGNMLELGWYSYEGHRKVGKRVACSGVDILITVGKLAEDIAIAASDEGFSGGILKVDSVMEASEILREMLVAGDTVLIKGSRAEKLEEIVDLLRNDKLIESS